MPRFLVRGVLPQSKSGDSEYHDITADTPEDAINIVKDKHPEYEKIKAQPHPESSNQN